MKLCLTCLLLFTFEFSWAQILTTKVVNVAGSKDGWPGEDSMHIAFAQGLWMDKSGILYISDWGNCRIMKWEPGKAYGKNVAGGNSSSYTCGDGNGELNYPWGVTLDTSGNIYVGDQNNSRVQKWAPGAKYGITVAGSTTNVNGRKSTQLTNPAGVFIDAKDNLYIADNGNNRVQMWAKGSNYAITVAGDKFCQSGSDSTHLNGPDGIFVDSLGNIYVSDANNNRVQKWAKGAIYGVTVAGQKNGTKGTDPSRLDHPTGIYVDSSGNVYVGDNNNNRVQMWAPGSTYGKTVAGQQDCSRSNDTAHLWNVGGVWVNKRGDVFVVDVDNHRVMEWSQILIPNMDLNISNSAFSISPNPTKSSFTIFFKSLEHIDNAKIEIINPLGQVIYFQLLDNLGEILEYTVNCKRLNSGIYFVKLTVGLATKTQKLVINN